MSTHARISDGRQTTRRAGRLYQARCSCGWQADGFSKDPAAAFATHLDKAGVLGWLYPTRQAIVVHYFPGVNEPSLCRRYYAAVPEAMSAGNSLDPRCKTCARKAPADV